MNQKQEQKVKRSPIIKEIFKDKNGFFNMRELTTALMVVMVTVGWVGQQFFGFILPDFMFFGFISLIASGCFGYSIEKKQRHLDKQETPSVMNIISEVVQGFTQANRKKPQASKEPEETNVEFEKEEEEEK